MTRLPRGFGYLMRFSKPGFTPARLVLESLESSASRPRLRVVLEPGRRDIGLVIDEDERPITGAEVRLSRIPAADADSQTVVGARTAVEPSEALLHLTDAEGRFEVSDLATGRYDLDVAASGFAPASIPGIEVPAAEPADDLRPIDLGAVVLQLGAAVEGWVIDPQGQPVAEAEIHAGEVGEPSSMTSSEPPHTTSDAEGRFLVADQRPGARLRLSVAKTGYVTANLIGVAGSGERPLEVVLKPAAKIAGRVFDEAGQPVGGAYVSVRPEGRGDGVRSELVIDTPRYAESSEDGRFEIAGVEPGRLTLTAEAAGFQPLRRAGLVAAGARTLGDLELTLKRGATLLGTVRDTAGHPVAGATVHIAAGEADDPTDAFARTDVAGRFELIGVGFGRRSLVAEDDNARRASRSVDVIPGTQTVDLVLEGGVEVSGWVRDVVGQPVAGATVLLTPQQAAGRPGQIPQTRSSTDGTFAFSNLAPGTYALVAGRPGFAMQPQGEPIEVADVPLYGLEIELDAGVTLRGRILGLDFDDLARVVVRASGANPGGGATTVGQVDYEGNYAVPHLAPGTVSVEAEIPGSGRLARAQLELPEGAPEAIQDLDFGH